MYVNKLFPFDTMTKKIKVYVIVFGKVGITR